MNRNAWGDSVRRALAAPLVHFLMVGLLLVGLYALFVEEPAMEEAGDEPDFVVDAGWPAAAAHPDVM
ncbi:hypothetical protein [Acuticoccus mangrovi]|uniref:Uncharacterized protein n=1 Tax=Acuticoccus mangrovi TaxID=2796142 RepID=A0A934IUN2_9HYPH|nr:hypothetical protein [Acuticoccus mangrovi]MBJ3778350.1 hypothetical protein [Acuticoccus mangrovi]